MRFSGVEPSSMILTQTMYCKLLKWGAKIMSKQVFLNDAKQVEANLNGVINLKSYNYYPIETLKILMLFKRYESTEVDRRSWIHMSSGTYDPPTVTPPSSWNTKRDVYQIGYSI